MGIKSLWVQNNTLRESALFKNWSIRNKVLMISFVSIIGFVIYLVANYVVSASTDRYLTSISENDFPVFETVNETAISVSALKITFSAAVDTGETAELDNARVMYEKISLNLKNIARLSPSNAEQVDAIQRELDNYFSASKQIAEGLMHESIDADTLSKLVPQINANFSTLENELEQLRESVKSRFSNRLEQVKDENGAAWNIGAVLSLVIILILVVFSIYVTRMLTRGLNHAVLVADKIAEGEWNTVINIDSNDETGHLLGAISTMRDRLKSRTEEDHRKERLQSQIADLNERMRGDQGIDELCRNILDYVTPTTKCQIGAIYFYESEIGLLSLIGSYAFTHRKGIQNHYKLGESLVGQVALEKKQMCISHLPENYMTIHSGLGSATPRNVLLTPILYESNLMAVVELGSVEPIDECSMLFLASVMDSIGIAINSVLSRIKLAEMLDKTQKQAESMERQQEELRASNEELEEQTIALRASEENLQAQQEELRVTNEELSEQAKILEKQKHEMLVQNHALEKAQNILREKSEALELSSKYKSEFLSTMSHELRTPLNSILILSNNLASNKKGNLDTKQIEHCEVIHSAGSDLLSLINDILDLSKVEEGKLQLVLEDLPIEIIRRNIQLNFDHVAKTKNIEFGITIQDNLPKSIITDRQRLEQILKNLLSNSFKFTQTGGVYLDIARPSLDMSLEGTNLSPATTIALTVRDTGIGIPKEKQQLVFEAFQQADGTTSRKYGGTGLGLTISRQLAKLLKGDLRITQSATGQGSSFTLFIPDVAIIEGAENLTQKSAEENPHPISTQANLESNTSPSKAAVLSASPQNSIAQNSDADSKPQKVAANPQHEKVVLIIEDDTQFAGLLADLAQEHDIATHICNDGESGIAYAIAHRPGAIILDVGLPDLDGFQVMERLRQHKNTQTIPVHFISGSDSSDKAMAMGAYDFLKKPISRDKIADSFSKIEQALKAQFNCILIIEDNEIAHQDIVATFQNKNLEIVSAYTAEEGIVALKNKNYDFMILDLDLPDMDGFTFLEKINADSSIAPVPVIVYTARDLMRNEEAKLRKYADRIILKTPQSSERLLNEASLFFNWLDNSNKDIAKQKILEPIDHRADIFKGKKLLVVDDDMRNIYSLTVVLEEKGFDIEIAMNGREAVDALNAAPDKDMVLMDIMMPEMDGYEAMTEIRKNPKFAKLPIIALTAKAMKNDRQKCIEAGANDYITKPIEADKLLSLMRVWLHKH
jgi:CheY-like chemotaxis protein/signal transduction histidine kinase/HAMP domain-containing protein